MCGINGIVSCDPNVDHRESLIEQMNQELVHRGPDGEGIWHGDYAGFGHRRLAIIDLSPSAAQPMVSHNGRYVFVCNGEIYNYRELRDHLTREGYLFKSNTDVEVIPPLFDQYGADCLNHLVGMFAFAIWDTQNRKLFVARDRIGEKPLYYTHKNGLFAFSSEIKALLKLPWVKPRINEEALPNLFVYPAVPSPLTFFQGISSLPPACSLSWHHGDIKVEKYWKVNFQRVCHASSRDLLDGYEHHLNQSVQGCLESDVPIGITLSGGVDSSSIAVAAKKIREQVKTFSISTRDASSSNVELSRARTVATTLGTNHHEIFFSLDQINRLPFIIHQYGQPLNNYACIYLDALTREIKKYVTVVLSGNGADETFGGYRGYNKLRKLEWISKLFRHCPSIIKKMLMGNTSNRLKYLLSLLSAPIVNYRELNVNKTSLLLMRKMCEQQFCNKWAGYLPGQHIAGLIEESGASNILQATMYSDLMLYHHHGHAIMPDISGMAYGLEIRSPFLDHRFIEYAFTLPYEQIVPSVIFDRDNKAIMKRYLERYLTEDIIYAKKIGFGYDIKVDRFMTGKWRQTVRRQVLEGKYRSLGIFSNEGIEWGLNSSVFTAWMLLSFSIWADLYLFGDKPEVIAERFGPS